MPMTAETPACFAVEFEVNIREVDDRRSPHDEFCLKLFSAATDEFLVAVTKVGIAPLLRSCGRGTRIQHSGWPIESLETKTTQKT
jgi:hypothetical protein